MPRTKIQLSYSKSFDETKQIIERTLLSDGYAEKTLASGELVWKKGSGLLTAMHFIKVEYNENGIELSGWVQTGIGNVGGKEMALEGFTGSIPKRSVLKTLEKIRQGIA